MQSPAVTRSRTILAVDDDDAIREMLRLALEMYRYRVVTAADGAEALARLRETPEVGLILLDLMMPEMDGWEFLAAVATDERLARIPVVVVTAFGDRAGAIRVKRILHKPIDLPLLLEAVREHCGSPD
jgi:CheY-like chemotaxis protein